MPVAKKPPILIKKYMVLGYPTRGYKKSSVKNFGSENRILLLKLLKESRIDAELRQVDLAGKLGVPQSLISKYEVGERRLDILELREICQVLGISLSEFVDRLELKLERVKHETD